VEANRRGGDRSLMPDTIAAHVRTGLCQEERKRMQAWKTALRELSVALKAFSAAIHNNFPSADCDRLRAEVERARLASDNARLSLAMHRNEHGC
jgi:hypothetical protein